MSEAKKYFYLKMKENFFERPEIKAIEGMQSGYEYICIIQKMYLRSLVRTGKLMLTDTIPYDITLLASVLGHKQETIKIAIEVFSKLGLIEVLDDQTIYMTEIQNFIGESTTEADRIRDYRRKIDDAKQLCVQMYDKCTPELELELKQELKIDNIRGKRPKRAANALVKKEPRPEEERKAFATYWAVFEKAFGHPLTDGSSSLQAKSLWELIDRAKGTEKDWGDFLDRVVKKFLRVVEEKPKGQECVSSQQALPHILNGERIWIRIVGMLPKKAEKISSELTPAERHKARGF